MVITIDSLNLQVKVLEGQYNNLLEGFANSIVNFTLQYQTNLQQTKANIDLLHKQIAGLVIEKQKAEKDKKKIKEVKKPE